MSPSLEQRLGRDRSFERLYRQHRRDVYGAVLRDVRDPDEAEDVTQIAFLNAFRAIRRGEEPEKPRAWLVTIARNVCRRRYRDLARRPQEVGFDPEVIAAVEDVEGPTAGEIAATIRGLPENQRAVILLREVQGRSYGEIATELGLSLSAVETLIFRARRNLSEQLELAEHAPVTQKRRARGWLALPFPGLPSLGISLSRMGVAAVVGGVAIVTAPLGGRPAESPSPPPSAGQAAVPHGVQIAELRLDRKAAPPRPPAREPRSSDPTVSGDQSHATSGTDANLPLVGTPAPVSVPSLPIQPALPPAGSVPPLPPPPPLPQLPSPLG